MVHSGKHRLFTHLRTRIDQEVLPVLAPEGMSHMHTLGIGKDHFELGHGGEIRHVALPFEVICEVRVFTQRNDLDRFDGEIEIRHHTLPDKGPVGFLDTVPAEQRQHGLGIARGMRRLPRGNECLPRHLIGIARTTRLADETEREQDA